MGGDSKKDVKGRILLVQEGRFRLLGEEGESYLFSLSHSASVSDSDLINWHKDNVEVKVRYVGEPDIESGIAHSVEPL